MSARPGEPAPGRWSADRRLAAAGPIQTSAVGLRRIANRPVLEPERPDGVDTRPTAGTSAAGTTPDTAEPRARAVRRGTSSVLATEPSFLVRKIEPVFEDSGEAGEP